MKYIRSLLMAAAALATIMTPSASGQVLINFESGSQLSGNFRTIGTATGTNIQTSNGALNDYFINNISDATGTPSQLIYDTTPGDITSGTQSTFVTSSSLTASFDFRSATANSSFGIIFVDPGNNANNILALFNVDAAGTTDRFRFFRDANLAGGTAGTQVGGTSNLSSGLDANGAITSIPFGNLSATLTLAGTTPTLSFTVGTQTVSQVFSSGDFDWTNTSVAMRLFDNGGTAATELNIDNFAVVPEPSPGLLFGLAGSVLFLIRRTRRTD